MKQFKVQFDNVSEARQKRQSILKKMDILDKQKVILTMEVESFHKTLLEEEKDVEKLEKVTFSSIINTILNTKVEKLEKEKEELYAARLKYEKLKDEYNQVIRWHDELKGKLVQYETAEHDYMVLIEEMTAYIEERNPKEAEKLQNLMDQRTQFENERISLNEALTEGEEVLKELNDAKRYLEKARDWGEYDLSGGGLVATIKKYHYLDEAQEILHKIQWGLRKFHNALKKLGFHQDKEIESFLKVSDYWIDGIFVDYSLQSAIIKLVNSMNDLIVEILSIDESLRREVGNSQKKKDAMKVAMDHFFERISE